MRVPSPPDPVVLPSRRTFVIRSCQAVSLAGTGVLLHACGGGGGNPAGPSGPPAPSMPVVAGSVVAGRVSVPISAGSPLEPVGGAALVQSGAGNFLVARTGATTFAALTATCTHEACTITGRQNETFVCPCHGSRFSNSGAVLNGPATRALTPFATTFENDTLTITP
jgi:cytochrome b6-f complex iron-sulfur subunit